jgi:hypothetical protein
MVQELVSLETLACACHHLTEYSPKYSQLSARNKFCISIWMVLVRRRLTTIYGFMFALDF